MIKKLIFPALLLAASLVRADLPVGAVAFGADARSGFSVVAARARVDSAVGEISRLCENAKREYSSRYNRDSNAAKTALIGELREYSKYASKGTDPSAKTLASEIRTAELLKLADENNFFEFRAAVVRAIPKVEARKSASARERKLLAALNAYALAASGKQDAEPVDDVELRKEEREYFNENCDMLVAAVDDYFMTGDDAKFNEFVRALGELRYYQPDSPAVSKIATTLRDLYSGRNFFIETSERFINAMATENISQSFPVQEYIREAFARGTGSVQGATSVDLRPNAQRAEILLRLDATTATQTVSESRGVYVNANASGQFVATKPIFCNPSGLLTTKTSSATGSMKSSVNGIDSDRPMLLGGLIVQNKVAQELPYSERESSDKASARLADELEKRANQQISELNRRISRMLERGSERLIRRLETSTSEDRLFVSCVIGRELQTAAPIPDVDRLIRNLVESNANQIAGSRLTESQSSERYSQFFLGTPAARMQPIATAPGVARFQPTSAAPGVVRVLPSVREVGAATAAAAAPQPASDADIRVRMHQSGPNNAVCIALAGAVFGPGADTIDDVIARFPGVDPNDIKLFLKPYEPKEQKPFEPDDVYREVFVHLDETQPFVTRFENGKINTVLRVASCEVDGKEWPPIEVRFVYKIENRGASIAFVRETVDVLPDGYVEGDQISAKFHTFRRIFMKRIETTIQNEYVAEPIALTDKTGRDNRGTLVPTLATAENGWLTLEFRYAPRR